MSQYAHEAIGIFGRTIAVYDIAETVVNHRAIKTPGADYNIFGVIQPAGERDLQILPEGDRTSGAIVVHTKDDLKIADSGSTAESYVRHRGKVYRVRALAPWDDQEFRRYVATTWQDR